MPAYSITASAGLSPTSRHLAACGRGPRGIARQRRGPVDRLCRAAAAVACVAVALTETPVHGQAESAASVMPLEETVMPLEGAQTATSAPQATDTGDWRKYLDWSAVNVTEKRSFPLGDTPAEFQPVLLRLVLDTIPHDYENNKKWGRTKEIWDGVDFRWDDGRLKTKRRRKPANHGTWTRYRVELVDPQENVRVDLSNIRQLESGEAAFDVEIVAKLDVYGRLQEWNRGLRLLSVSTDATADVRLVFSCTLATRLDVTRIPPDLVFSPQVTAAELRLVDLQLHRISKADGPVVRELSWSVEQLLRDELAEKNGKLVAKMNRQIDKHAQDLRISSSRFVKQKLLGESQTPK